MRILIDGEACPKSTQKICLKTAKKYRMPIYIVADFKRQSLDGEVFTESEFNPMPGTQDYTLSSLIQKDDIVITYDYNLAAEVYPKVLVVIHPAGFIYNDSNMDKLLYERYLSRKQHDPNGEKGAKIQKQNEQENRAFTILLRDIVASVEEKAPYIGIIAKDKK